MTHESQWISEFELFLILQMFWRLHYEHLTPCSIVRFPTWLLDLEKQFIDEFQFKKWEYITNEISHHISIDFTILIKISLTRVMTRIGLVYLVLLLFIKVAWEVLMTLNGDVFKLSANQKARFENLPKWINSNIFEIVPMSHCLIMLL